MARAKLQDLPVEVLLLLPEYVSDRDGDRYEEKDGDGDRASDSDDDNDDDDDDDDDSNSDDDNDNEGDDEDDDRNSYADIVSSRQNLIGWLARVNRRFHSIFEPILYRTAVKAKNNAITTLAARDDRLETLKKAVEYGADLNVVTWVPIAEWTSGRGKAIRECRNCPEDTSYGFCWATPLHMAASDGHYRVVKYLISIGVDLDVPGKLMCSCLSIAETMASFPPDEWDKMVVVSPVWTPLHYAICRRKGVTTRLLIIHGASLNNTRFPVRSEIPRGNGVAQLFGLDPTNSEKAAAIRKRLKSLICSIGTSGSMFNYPNFRRLEQWSQWSPAGTTMSALQTAVAINDYTMARHLIVNHGVDIYATDGAGATTLHYSLMTGKIKMVRYLLSLGADPNVCLDLNSDLLPIQNAAGWVVFYHDQYSNGGVTKFLDQALQALLDSGVTCWVQRSEGDSDDDLKSCVVNKYHTWWNEKNLIPPYDGCFKRFLKGAIKEYDPANDCRDLKQEIYDLFWDVLISYSYRNTVTILDTLTEAVGSIDFTVETPERFRRRTNIPQNERVSLGAAFFRALSSREKPPKDMKGKRLTQTLAKIDWLMKQSVLTTPEMWQYSAALIREQCRRESES
uniref:Ankyrin repeat protein n=1 Tax=Colletotrichum fructicola (strain Nara gc5) TaxID=1213859 RepID=L2FHL3_COLFN